MSSTYRAGLHGIVAAQTAISSVDGDRGRLIVRGFSIEDLAPRESFEGFLYLLWHDVLPDQAVVDRLSGEIAARRELEPSTIALLKAAAARRVGSMDALRMACASLPAEPTELADGEDRAQAAWREAVRLVAAFPVIVAAYHRLSRREEPIAPRSDLPHVANFLYMLHGREASAEIVRALETYWNTVADHGLNASTFTARVIVSTESDVVSAVTGAVGALKGPLHGGAPGPALDLVFEVGTADRAERILREKLSRGERLMGFGHRVYRTRDPRADVLGSAAEALFQSAEARPFYDLARAVEDCAERLLREYKPGRSLKTNVEFYTALLLHGVGLPTQLFTPVFASARVAGWTAHCLEQISANRLFRPQSEYIGGHDRRWMPMGERQPVAAERR